MATPRVAIDLLVAHARSPVLAAALPAIGSLAFSRSRSMALWRIAPPVPAPPVHADASGAIPDVWLMWIVNRPTVTSVPWLIVSAALAAPGVVPVAKMTVPW